MIRAAHAVGYPVATPSGSFSATDNSHRSIPLKILSLSTAGDTDANLSIFSPERRTALHSCEFALDLLRVADQEGLKGACEQFSAYVTTFSSAVDQLHDFFASSCARDLVGHDDIVSKIASRDWAFRELRNDVSDYIEDLIGRLHELHQVLAPSTSSLVESPAGYDDIFGGLAGTIHLIKQSLRRKLWDRCVEAGYALLLDGWSKCRRCSTEGRALMSMDVQALSGGVEGLCGGNSEGIDRHYVVAWVNAYYFGEDDLMIWMEGNSSRYHAAHMLSLAATSAPGGAHGGVLRRLKQQSSRLYHRIEKLGSFTLNLGGEQVGGALLAADAGNLAGIATAGSDDSSTTASDDDESEVVRDDEEQEASSQPVAPHAFMRAILSSSRKITLPGKTKG